MKLFQIPTYSKCEKFCEIVEDLEVFLKYITLVKTWLQAGSDDSYL
jgi:hypothetical protein